MPDSVHGTQNHTSDFVIFYFAVIIINPVARLILLENTSQGFPGGAVVKNPPANAGDMGSSPGSGRSHMPRSN